MKKKIAIMLTLILATGTFTACTAEEKMDNSSLSPTVSTSVGVSVSGETSATATTEKTTETTTAEKTTVSKETELSEENTKAKEKADITPATKVMNFFKFIRNTQLINLTLPLTEKHGDSLIHTVKNAE